MSLVENPYLHWADPCTENSRLAEEYETQVLDPTHSALTSAAQERNRVVRVRQAERAKARAEAEARLKSVMDEGGNLMAQIERLAQEAKAGAARFGAEVSDPPSASPTTPSIPASASSTGLPARVASAEARSFQSALEELRGLVERAKNSNTSLGSITKPSDPLVYQGDAKTGMGCATAIVVVVVTAMSGNLLPGLFVGALLYFLPLIIRNTGNTSSAQGHAGDTLRACAKAREAFGDVSAGIEVERRALAAQNAAADPTIDKANAHFERVRLAAEARVLAAAESFGAQFGVHKNRLALGVQDWVAPAWREWSPSTSPVFSGRIGSLSAVPSSLLGESTVRTAALALPALVEIQWRSLLLDPGSFPAKQCIQAVKSLLARLVANIPPGKFRFTFIDPVGLGENVASFMSLADYEESLITSRAWSEASHIELRLAKSRSTWRR